MHILMCICLRCAGLLSRMSETIDRVFLDARQKSQGLGLVGLVGGSSRLPMVQQMLRRKFGQAKVRRKPQHQEMHMPYANTRARHGMCWQVCTSLNPDTVIAMGAAAQAAIIAGEGTGVLSDILLLDATSLSLGLEGADGQVSR